MGHICASYCTADSYIIDELAKTLKLEKFDCKFYDDVIHISTPAEKTDVFSQDGHTQPPSGKMQGNAYIFSYGCAVFWGVDPETMCTILGHLRKHALNPLESYISDECTYSYGEETVIKEEEDEIVLDPNDPLILLALSYGLSQSVKLTFFEGSIAQTIQKSRHIPEEFARKGKITLSRQKLSRKIGALFAEHHSINLHSDLLDVPEFFWRRPKYESYYHMAAEYLDITTRTSILNQRLTILHELYGMLSDELKHLHSSRLEWIIISLIIMEVIMSILHYVGT
jgi:uncharacterized Rmd1/YagE family protein